MLLPFWPCILIWSLQIILSKLHLTLCYTPLGTLIVLQLTISHTIFPTLIYPLLHLIEMTKFEWVMAQDSRYSTLVTLLSLFISRICFMFLQSPKSSFQFYNFVLITHAFLNFMILTLPWRTKWPRISSPPDPLVMAFTASPPPLHHRHHLWILVNRLTSVTGIGGLVIPHLKHCSKCCAPTACLFIPTPNLFVPNAL